MRSPEQAYSPWGIKVAITSKAQQGPTRQTLSYQLHYKCRECQLIIRREEKPERPRDPGQERDRVDILVQTAHRIKNKGPASLVVIEIRQEEYLDEDDIFHLKDDYGRLR